MDEDENSQGPPAREPRSRADAGTRREFLIAGAAIASGGAAGAVAAADVPKGHSAKDASNPGPDNAGLSALSPNSFNPPKTDHGDVPSFWASFATAHRRIQPGGWTRQVNVRDFPMSKEIAGVNMRLTAGGVRELHWHVASEWALMLAGKARLTAIDAEGRGYVSEVAEGDLWFFPGGIPHSIQGLGPDGCEFLLVFDDGDFSEFNTTLLSDWTAHVPKEVLAKNWGVAESALAGMPKEELYIFQAEEPGPLAAAKAAAAGARGPSPLAFDFRLSTMPPTKATAGGEVRIIDTTNFPVSTSMAAAHVTVRPGGLRELHWHPNADEWQYYVRGQGRMTLFLNGGNARTMDFRAGDVGYAPKSMGHYVENSGDTDLVFIETFRADRFQDLTLSDWVTHTPPDLIRQHLGIARETLAKFPADKPNVVPR